MQKTFQSLAIVSHRATSRDLGLSSQGTRLVAINEKLHFSGSQAEACSGGVKQDILPRKEFTRIIIIARHVHRKSILNLMQKGVLQVIVD